MTMYSRTPERSRIRPLRLLLMLLAAGAISCCLNVATATDYYVRTSGNDRNNGTASNRAWKTIARAIAQSPGPGDVVYVGAGTYQESISASTLGIGGSSGGNGSGNRNNGGTSSSTLNFFADTTGRYTADRGDVILTPVGSGTFLSLTSPGAVVFQGFTFGTPSGGISGTGISISNSSSQAVGFSSCHFQNLQFAVRGDRSSVALAACDFKSCSYGVYCSNGTTVGVDTSSFADMSGWGLVASTESAVIANCTFNGSRGAHLTMTGNNPATLSDTTFTGCDYGLQMNSSPVSLSDPNAVRFIDCDIGAYLSDCDSSIREFNAQGCRLPLYIVRGTTNVQGLSLSGNTYGLYAANMDSVLVNGCAFATTGAWGCVLTGTSLDIQSSNFTGTHGLYVVESSGSSSPTLKNLSFSDCQYGIQISNSRVQLSSGDNINMRDCYIGLYLVSCDSDLTELEINGGYLPFYLNRGTADLDRIKSSDGSYGVYAVNMDGLVLNRGEFTTSSSWGCVATGSGLSIRNTTFNGTYGLSLNSAEAPVLERLTFRDCSTGLQAQNGPIRLTAASQLQFENCRIGVYLANCDSTLTGLTLQGGYLPLYLNNGSSAVDTVTIQNSSYGLYAVNMQTLSARALNVSGHSAWGMYATGTNLGVNSSSITSGAHGVYLRDSGTNGEVDMFDLTVTGNTGYGVYLPSTSLKARDNRNVIIRDNGSVGLRFDDVNVNLTGSSGIELTGNGYGVYVTNGNATLSGLTLNSNGYGVFMSSGDATLSGLTLSNNGHGVYSSSGRLTCSDSTITGGNFGIRQAGSEELQVRNVSISGASNWGIHVNTSAAQSAPLVLDRVSVTGGANGVYLAVPTGSSVAVTNSTVSQQNGYGLLSYRSTATVAASEFSNNQSVGLYHIDGPLTVRQSVLARNGSYGVLAAGSATPDAATLDIANSRVSANSSGIGVWNADSAKIANNIIDGNSNGVLSRTNGDGTQTWHNTLSDNQTGLWHYSGTGTLHNNIIAIGDMDDAVQNATGIYVQSGGLVHSHNLLFGQTQAYRGTSRGAGEIIKPPRFVDRAAGDFRLSKGSPAINAGTSAGTLVSMDLAGVARSSFGAPEAGAFEYLDQAGSIRIIDWKELAGRPTP